MGEEKISFAEDFAKFKDKKFVKLLKRIEEDMVNKGKPYAVEELYKKVVSSKKRQTTLANALQTSYGKYLEKNKIDAVYFDIHSKPECLIATAEILKCDLDIEGKKIESKSRVFSGTIIINKEKDFCVFYINHGYKNALAVYPAQKMKAKMGISCILLKWNKVQFDLLNKVTTLKTIDFNEVNKAIALLYNDMGAQHKELCNTMNELRKKNNPKFMKAFDSMINRIKSEMEAISPQTVEDDIAFLNKDIADTAVEIKKEVYDTCGICGINQERRKLQECEHIICEACMAHYLEKQYKRKGLPKCYVPYCFSILPPKKIKIYSPKLFSKDILDHCIFCGEVKKVKKIVLQDNDEESSSEEEKEKEKEKKSKNITKGKKVDDEDDEEESDDEKVDENRKEEKKKGKEEKKEEAEMNNEKKGIKYDANNHSMCSGCLRGYLEYATKGRVFIPLKQDTSSIRKFEDIKFEPVSCPVPKCKECISKFVLKQLYDDEELTDLKQSVLEILGISLPTIEKKGLIWDKIDI